MDETRERLINSAGEVFAEKGFDQATIREICSRANANIAAVNYHFGDKERLYIEAVMRAHCERGGHPSSDWPAELPAEQQLALFVERMMEDMLDRDCPSWHTELIMREMSRPTAACSELVQSYIGPKFELLMGILEQLLPEAMPLRRRRLFAFSVVGQCLLYRFHRPVGRLLIGDDEFQSLFDARMLARHITEFTMHGIERAHAVDGRHPLSLAEGIR